jgi:hypothetical protein
MTPRALHAEEQIQRTSDDRDLKSWLPSFFFCDHIFQCAIFQRVEVEVRRHGSRRHSAPATVSQGFGKLFKRLRRLGTVGITTESIAFIAR